MASDTVSLYLGGDPTLDDFADAMDALRKMLTGLSKLERTAPITWTIEDLERSSAYATFRAEADRHEEVERVTTRYLATGRDLLAGRDLPRPIRSGGRKLLDILNSRVPDLRMETADDDVTIAATEKATQKPVEASATWGAAEGRIQTLSNRGSLHFTLYDLVYDKPVSCYLQAEQQEQMRDAWGRMAIVEGSVKRDPETGRPQTIRGVRNVEMIDEGRRGDWRKAEGVLKGVGRDEPAEVTIRRLRDAQ